jgi:nitrous oxide reductase
MEKRSWMRCPISASITAVRRRWEKPVLATPALAGAFTAILLDHIHPNCWDCLYDAFTEPEPHYAQVIRVDRLHPIEVYSKEENKDPNAIWDVKDAGVTRNGKNVIVKMIAVRSSFSPSSFEVNQGDHVTVYLTAR